MVIIVILTSKNPSFYQSELLKYTKLVLTLHCYILIDPNVHSLTLGNVLVFQITLLKSWYIERTKNNHRNRTFYQNLIKNFADIDYHSNWVSADVKKSDWQVLSWSVFPFLAGLSSSNFWLLQSSCYNFYFLFRFSSRTIFVELRFRRRQRGTSFPKTLPNYPLC